MLKRFETGTLIVVAELSYSIRTLVYTLIGSNTWILLLVEPYVLDQRRSYAFGLIRYADCMGSRTLSSPPAPLSTLHPLFLPVHSSLYTASPSFITHPLGLQTSAQSIPGVISGVASIVGNAGGGWIMENYGSNVLYRTTSAMVLGSTVLFLCFSAYRRSKLDRKIDQSSSSRWNSSQRTFINDSNNNQYFQCGVKTPLPKKSDTVLKPSDEPLRYLRDKCKDWTKSQRCAIPEELLMQIARNLQRFFHFKNLASFRNGRSRELLNSNLAISALAYWANFVGVSQATLYDRIEKQIASKQRSMTELPDDKNGCKRNALRACRGQSRL